MFLPVFLYSVGISLCFLFVSLFHSYSFHRLLLVVLHSIQHLFSLTSTLLLLLLVFLLLLLLLLLLLVLLLLLLLLILILLLILSATATAALLLGAQQLFG